MPLTERLSELMTPASPILWMIQLLKGSVQRSHILWLSRIIERKDEGKPTATSLFALSTDGSAVLRDDLPDTSKTDTGSLGAPADVGSPTVALEDVW